MSLLFGDVYEAIRTMRVQKGVCEKDILNYVQDKAGGCMKVSNVLKTIKTLKKLVEDGVLVKKGKRYMFASAAKCPNEEEEEEDECDEEDEEDECDEEEEEEEDECKAEEEEEEDQCCEDEEEENESEKENNQCNLAGDDDDYDDDDDEDDDDDDDYDDDNCKSKDDKAKEASCAKEGAQEVDTSKENGNDLQCVSTDKLLLSTNKGNSDDNNNCGERKSRERQCVTTEGGGEKGTERQSERGLIGTTSEGKSRGGTENIAFCVRDLLDSLYRPSSQGRCKDDENLTEVGDMLHENMDTVKNGDIGKVFQERKKKFQGKRTKTSRNKYRSRSPIKKNEANAFTNLELDCSKDLCCRTISSQYLHEPMDADEDVASGKDNEVEIEIESDYHNPFNTLTSKTSMKAIEKKKSNSIYEEQKEKAFSQNAAQMKLATFSNKNMKNVTNLTEEDEEEQEKEKRRRKVKRKGKFIDEEINISDDEKTSLCSICEKEKQQ